MKLALSLPMLAVFSLSTAGAFAQAIVPSYSNYSTILGGTTAGYQWSGYTDVNRPGGVAAGVNGKSIQWPAGIAPNGGAPGIIFLGNQSFGTDTTDFLAASNGGGIYAFFSQTHFQINSTVPLSNMESLVLQLSIAEGLSGMFGGSAVTLASNPTLTLVTSGGTFTDLAPNFSLFASQIPSVVNGMNTNVDRLDFQWDFSSIPGTVTGYTINWQEPFHGEVFGQDVTESSAVHATNALVPEPSAGIAAIGGLALLLAMRRSRRTVLT